MDEDLKKRSKAQRADGTAISEHSRGKVLSEEAQGEGNLFHLGMYAKAYYNLDTMLGSHQ